jgi:segregation and condensation protein A
MPGPVDAMTDDGAAEGERTPLLSLEGYHGSLEALLTLARARQIERAKIPVLDLVDQLTAAVRDAPAATPMGQKSDWLVMASWLVQLRSRLLLPADAAVHQEAKDAADCFRDRLAGLAVVQALAAWLEDRPQLGRDVFVRGQRPEGFNPAMETVPGIDVIEFLWVSMALFDDGNPAPDVSDAYRPPARELYSIPEARARILQRLSETPDGLALELLLPDDVAVDPMPALRKRDAWTSTLIAGLELAKQGDVTLAQADPFTAVHVNPVSADPPA